MNGKMITMMTVSIVGGVLTTVGIFKLLGGTRPVVAEPVGDIPVSDLDLDIDDEEDFK